MDGFRFILENPHPSASNNKQRKRARLVTACDSCRVKKIKCQQSFPNSRCEACKTAKTPCLFGDRDRYQAERGVTCTWSTPAQDPPLSPEDTRRRKLPGGTSSQFPLVHSFPSVEGSSRSASPSYSYYTPNQADPSYVGQFNAYPSTSQVDGGLNSLSNASLPLFDPARPRYPHPYRMRGLGNLFFDTVGMHFPFLDRFDVLHRIEHRTCSAILCNTIGALALRFADSLRPDATAGNHYFDMAKTLAHEVAATPSVEALHALLVITWAEYSTGNDDSFWRYSRMAITMGLDLGLGHEATIRVATVPETRTRLRLTWWAVVCVEDLAASWATGRPSLLDLSQFDTELPPLSDDRSSTWRVTIQMLILHQKFSRAIQAYAQDNDEAALEWKLADMRVEWLSIAQEISPTLVFTETNLLNSQDGKFGHVFVLMHLFLQALSILINRPSIVPNSNLPTPPEDQRTEAARTAAKSLVDILAAAQTMTPRALCDPILDLPILTAARLFIAESDSSASSANDIAKQWSETFLNKCKEALLRISTACGSRASFDRLMSLHGGNLSESLRSLSPSSSLDVFSSSSHTNPWLLKPSLIEDNDSDTSSSFRAGSREVSPYLAATPGTVPDFLSSSSLVNTPSIVAHDSATGLGSNDFSFEATNFLTGGPLNTTGEFFGLPSYLETPSSLHLSIDTADVTKLLNLDLYSRKETDNGLKTSPSDDLFSSSPWLSQSIA